MSASLVGSEMCIRDRTLDLSMARVGHLPTLIRVPLDKVRLPKWHRRKGPACSVDKLERPDVQEK
eukprot:3906163-Alexandrium_andersonii.AAC.1